MYADICGGEQLAAFVKHLTVRDILPLEAAHVAAVDFTALKPENPVPFGFRPMETKPFKEASGIACVPNGATQRGFNILHLRIFKTDPKAGDE
jgi:hypothetical protein